MKTVWPLLLLFPLALAAKAPNVLIILADDCTYNDLPLYGGKNAKTPNLDALAAEGLTFNKAYLAEAMCQPCRSELYSGLYPMRNGCAWNHSGSRPSVTSMPQHLEPRGYRVGLAGKGHVKPQKAFPFEKVAGFDPSCVRDPTRAHELGPAKAFMAKDASKPFCLVIALVEPHVPWVMGDASQYPPNKIQLPPNIADTPQTRIDFGRYLAEITYMDGQVGEILETVNEAGLADDTLVLFSSEQGSQFPGCKWTNWDTGLHTALIARWPGVVPVGKRTDALVQYVDVLPTLMELAGGETKGFDGQSFAGVLKGETDTHRAFVYGIHNNLPEGPSYPIRSISDGEYRYIWNLKHEALYIEKHLMGRRGDGRLNNPYWGTWVFHSGENAQAYSLITRFMHRPRHQLYHTAKDPYEMVNLADDPNLALTEGTLAGALHDWMEEQGDPGQAVDSEEALQAARRGEHLYGKP